MRSLLSLSLVLAGTLAASADKIIPPTNLFRDPTFVRDFVGSYGFESGVEPEVGADEQRALAKIREMFGEGRFNEAEAVLVRYIKQVESPDNPDQAPGEISPAMIFVLGNLYFSAERVEEARRAFLEAIRRFPNFRRAHVNLAYLYVSQEDLDKAAHHFQEAVRLGAGSARVFGLLGYCHLLEKLPLAAENAYRQAYLLDPANKDWKLGLAQALMQQEKLAEASTMLGTLIENYPEDRQLWLQQANALLGQERKSEAAVNLEVLRMKGLAGIDELNLLGNLYMDQGEPQLALFAFLAAIDQGDTPDVDRALTSARILNDYGFPEKAEVLVSKIRQRGADTLSDAQETKLKLVEVRIARSSGDRRRVGALLTRLSKEDPTNGEVLLELGRHYDTLAKTEENEDLRSKHIIEAKTHFQLAINLKEVAYNANLGLGQMLVREGQCLAAMPYIEKAHELKPSENLKLYVSRVRRAADREQQREERETAERDERRAAQQLKQPRP